MLFHCTSVCVDWFDINNCCSYLCLCTWHYPHVCTAVACLAIYCWVMVVPWLAPWHLASTTFAALIQIQLWTCFTQRSSLEQINKFNTKEPKFPKLLRVLGHKTMHTSWWNQVADSKYLIIWVNEGQINKLLLLFQIRLVVVDGPAMLASQPTKF